MTRKHAEPQGLKMSCKEHIAEKCCRQNREKADCSALTDVIRLYRKECCSVLEDELGKFKKVYETKGLEELIRAAASGKDPKTGRKMPHQRRSPADAVLQQWAEVLHRSTAEIDRCRSFEQLHELLEKKRLKGVGPLTCYDTAQRIGYALGFPPKECVYLHAGAQLPGEKKESDGRVPINELAKELTEAFPAYHIENLLCIYKHELASIGSLRKNQQR